MRKYILNGYLEISNKIEGVKRLIFDVNTLRMMFHAGMNKDIILEKISKNIDEYFSMKMPDKYIALKEIIGVLKVIVNYPDYHQYYSLYNRIFKYMEKFALPDIDNYIDILKDFEVHERCSMEREKVGVLKEYVKPYNFQNIYRNMADIKDMFGRNGMFMDMIQMDLNIADECCSPDNFEGEYMKSEPLSKMKEHMKLAENNIAKIKNHPLKHEFNLRLAYYFLVTLGG